MSHRGQLLPSKSSFQLINFSNSPSYSFSRPFSAPKRPLRHTARSIDSINEPYSSLDAYTFRRLKLEDIDSVAALCLEAFGNKDGARFRTIEQWEKQISAALAGKEAAQTEVKFNRIVAQNEAIRSQLAQLEINTPKNSKLKAEREAMYLKRRRSFFCYVAKESSSQKIVGCVALTLARPEAMLPPPFPSSARLRSYISNMAVAESHRRQGVATALVSRCERIARLLGYQSVWLHVDAENQAAVQLYDGLGYAEQPWVVGKFPLYGRKQQRLLAKPLRPLDRSFYKRFESSIDSSGVGGSVGENGVFVWGLEEQ